MPPRLRAGDLVGLIGPSGNLEDAQIERGVRNLESLGLRVKLGKNLRAQHGGYAGTVAQRVEDLHEMFRDREVRGMWAARGGAGASGMLDLIDYGLIRRNPKVLVGFSDITALHLALLRRAGLVTFHGPVSSSTFSEYSAANLRAVLMEPAPTHTFIGAHANFARALAEPQFETRVYREGVAAGRLVGGNLSVACALVGTPYGPRPGPNLVFLEEVREAPYRIDRMMTQLRQAGVLTSAAGVMMGVFSRCDPPAGDASLTLQQVLAEQMAALTVPSAYGYSFGHIAQQMTLPVGVMARMDTYAQTLTLLEPAVV